MENTAWGLTPMGVIHRGLTPTVDPYGGYFRLISLIVRLHHLRNHLGICEIVLNEDTTR